MGRPFRRLVHVQGTLVAGTPIHVGGERGDALVDLVLVLDGAGRPVIPGTSLAGAFRSWASTHVNDSALVDRVFGFEDERSDNGQASRLLVDDGVVTAGSVPIQFYTAIDRWSGTAFERSLHSREIIPRGSTIQFGMILESSCEEDEALLGHLLEAMSPPGRFRLGSAKTRGLGEVSLRECSIEVEDWTKRDSVVRALSGLRDTTSLADLQNLASIDITQGSSVEVSVAWAPRLPVMVSEDGDEIDTTARVESEGERVYLSLPGSAIKGALRSRAEHIVRTLLGRNLQSVGRPGRQWEQIALPVVDDLFGVVLHHGTEARTESGNIGALAVSSIRSVTSIGVGEWEALQAVSKQGVKNSEKKDRNLAQLLRNVNGSLRDKGAGSRVDVGTHIAIDRFAGGAADSALYLAIEPHAFKWENLVMSIDIDRLGDRARPALGLLMNVLTELGSGWIPLGFGGNRGYGAIEVSSIEFRPGSIGIDGTDVNLGVSMTNGRWEPGDVDLLKSLADELEVVRA